MFKALLLQKDDAGFRAAVSTLDEAALPQPPNAVLVALEFSTINYKDGLAITQRGPVVRTWPMVAGIDGVGRVLDSADPRFASGDIVVLNGFGAGEVHWGCLAERARLNGDWLIKLPAGLTPRDAMAVGTAGYTAMLSVLAVSDAGVGPGQGPVLVTGATGGVGSFAVALLAKSGYEVIASSGKASEADYLKSLGAREVIDRATLSAAGKALQREHYAAVIDSVGSHTLANACAQTKYGGVVTACGLAQGMDFPGSVAPFILRGIRLIGIDSVMAPRAARERAWAELAARLDRSILERIAPATIALEDVVLAAQHLMRGESRGRVVVDVRR